MIPPNGGRVQVHDSTDFIFIPERTGLWDIYTSDNGDSDPRLTLIGERGEVIIVNDDSAGDLNSLILANLDAGVAYTIRADFYEVSTSSYMLNVEPTSPTSFSSYRSTMPASGGVFTVTSSTEFEFTPDRSGTWTIFTSDCGDSDPYLIIYNSAGRGLEENDDFADDYNAQITIDLTARETYYIYASFYGTTVGRYTLTVVYGERQETAQIPRPEVGGVIPDMGGEMQVNGATVYEFAPNNSGLWIMTTSNNGNSDPYLEVIDDFGELIDYDDDSMDGTNARLYVFLEGGRKYYVNARFYDENASGRYTLSVMPPPELPGNGGEFPVEGVTIFMFSPSQSGMWEFRTSNSGDSDPMIAVLSREGDIIAEDDDSGGGFDALLTIPLNAGEVYLVAAGFYEEIAGARYLLTITRR